MSFAKPSKLILHTFKHHENDIGKLELRFDCIFCSKRFEDRDKLRKHITSKNKNGQHCKQLQRFEYPQLTDIDEFLE